MLLIGEVLGNQMELQIVCEPIKTKEFFFYKDHNNIQTQHSVTLKCTAPNQKFTKIAPRSLPFGREQIGRDLCSTLSGSTFFG